MTSITPARDPAAGTKVEVSVVLPCLNEAATVVTCVTKARRFFEESGVHGEVVVGDNGSTDGSQDLATGAGARVVHVAERGYGAALMAAIDASTGPYVIMADSDDSYDLGALAPFMERLRAGDELVMGNRFRGGILPGAMPWKNRWIGNPVLTGIGRVLFGTPCGDFHCGQRGFSRGAYERMELQTTGMEFASEMVIKATLLGLRVSEVPVTLKPDGRNRPPHLRPWRDGWRHLRFMLLFSPDSLFLVPGALLSLVGLLGMVILYPGPHIAFGVAFDISTFIFCAAAVLLGYQTMSFAGFARIHGEQQGFFPPSRLRVRSTGQIGLEVGLLVGAGAMLAGLTVAVMSVLAWRAEGFGPLDASVMGRPVVVAAVAMVLGAQTIFSSFLMSILRIQVRRGGR